MLQHVQYGAKPLSGGQLYAKTNRKNNKNKNKNEMEMLGRDSSARVCIYIQ